MLGTGAELPYPERRDEVQGKSRELEPLEPLSPGLAAQRPLPPAALCCRLRAGREEPYAPWPPGSGSAAERCWSCNSSSSNSHSASGRSAPSSGRPMAGPGLRPPCPAIPAPPPLLSPPSACRGAGAAAVFAATTTAAARPGSPAAFQAGSVTLGGGAGSGWARGPGPGRPPPARALPPAVFSAPRSACCRLFSSPACPWSPVPLPSRREPHDPALGALLLRALQIQGRARLGPWPPGFPAEVASG